MNILDLSIILLFCGVAGFLRILALYKYLRNILAEIRYVKIEMERASAWDDYVFWRSELRVLYWSLLPCLNPDRVHRIHEWLLDKRGGNSKESDRLMSMLMPSVLGIAVCSFCLIGSTYAWFSASVTVPSRTIKSAQYAVAAEISDGTDNHEIDGEYTLHAGNEYTVTLVPSGTASSGYCEVKLGDKSYYTDNIPFSDTDKFTFTLSVTQSDVKMQIFSYWCSKSWGSKSSPNIIGGAEYEFSGELNRKDIGSEQNSSGTLSRGQSADSGNTQSTVSNSQDDIYTVVSGDTLDRIASRNSTTVDKIAAYNQITDTNSIKAGQKIKIPPTDFDTVNESQPETSDVRDVSSGDSTESVIDSNETASADISSATD